MKTLKEHNFFGFDATMVADSKNEFGNRLSTMVITFPRYILAEMNTHRLFSRNSASSRAIPFNKMVERVQSNPFIPIAWQKDHKGMQGSDYLDEERSNNAYANWQRAAEKAIEASKAIYENYFNDEDSRVTKQLANRLLEPFMWHTVILSGTEFSNFFELRCPKYIYPAAASVDKRFKSWKDVIKYTYTLSENTEQITVDNISNYTTLQQRLKQNEGMADIHMMEIAEKMWDCYNESTPKLLKAGEWHIPFENEIDKGKLAQSISPDKALIYNNLDINIYMRKISIATCARISFGNIDPNKYDYVKECEFADKLVADGHWSPAEHIAKSMTREEYSLNVKGIVPHIATLSQGVVQNRIDEKSLGWVNNFRGFIQERYLLENQ